ncbi:hypothetical protein PTE30175_03666 [Pandoraea terrae]|uniref:Uncharacterized protein n=1 Tax=Pandoraea terrae TaxID=1537710 RepID=A0A5E4XAH4_9BURK|nr:hypothetical protein [Pandoraea terrae]VVE33192.1 hypothetical protein PTE30175_03666 [Pandoraea terrae]
MTDKRKKAMTVPTMHPAIQEDRDLVESLVAVATQFLADADIRTGGDQYRADLQTLQEDEDAFVRALMFAKHMYPNENFPDGMTEQDIDPQYLARYPFMAAVGIIDAAARFMELSDRIAEHPSPVQCHNYALAYWRIKWLADALKMSDVYKDNFRRHQRKIASAPRGARPDALQRLIEEIVEADPTYGAKRVLRQLEKLEPDDVIMTVTDTFIEWQDDDKTIKKTPIHGLKDRVSRAKAALKIRA